MGSEARCMPPPIAYRSDSESADKTPHLLHIRLQVFHMLFEPCVDVARLEAVFAHANAIVRLRKHTHPLFSQATADGAASPLGAPRGDKCDVDHVFFLSWVALLDLLKLAEAEVVVDAPLLIFGLVSPGTEQVCANAPLDAVLLAVKPVTAADIDAAVVFVALRADAEVLIADRLVGLSLSHLVAPF